MTIFNKVTKRIYFNVDATQAKELSTEFVRLNQDYLVDIDDKPKQLFDYLNKVKLEEMRNISQNESITQDDIAEKIGINRNNISRIFQGKHQPGFGIVLAIAESIGYEVEFKKKNQIDYDKQQPKI